MHGVISNIRWTFPSVGSLPCVPDLFDKVLMLSYPLPGHSIKLIKPRRYRVLTHWLGDCATAWHANHAHCCCSSPSISPPVSLPRYGMVGTMAGDSAPRSLSDFRSSGVCCSFSDSSLVGLRPFSLPLFHPSRAGFRVSSLSFAVLAGLLPQVATYDHSFTFVDLQATSTPLGRLTCVLSALPTSPWSKRPRNRLHLPCTLRETAIWLVFVSSLFSRLLLSRKIFFKSFQWNCDFLLSFCWQKGDRPDNDLRWAMQHPDKKTILTLPTFATYGVG